MWEGKEGRTGMVRNPGPCSSSLDTGIIPSSEPSPHWLASRLGFSFRLGPWHHGYCFFGMADSSLVVWLSIELFGLQLAHWPEGLNGPNTSINCCLKKKILKDLLQGFYVRKF